MLPPFKRRLDGKFAFWEVDGLFGSHSGPEVLFEEVEPDGIQNSETLPRVVHARTGETLKVAVAPSSRLMSLPVFTAQT
jgi:hypothetical protein